MGQELVCYFHAFNQVGERLLADKELQDGIKARDVVNPGDDDLTEHLINAAAKSEGEKSLRIVKKSDSKKIDLAVCLSMAHHEAVRLNI
jgi:phage terminase large subunit-like protein